jgi:hypothetical protein
MRIDKLNIAIAEANRFLKSAKLAQVRIWETQAKEGECAVVVSKENGSCRRASMDLTRALAELRK